MSVEAYKQTAFAVCDNIRGICAHLADEPAVSGSKARFRPASAAPSNEAFVLVVPLNTLQPSWLITSLGKIKLDGPAVPAERIVPLWGILREHFGLIKLPASTDGLMFALTKDAKGKPLPFPVFADPSPPVVADRVRLRSGPVKDALHPAL